MSRVRLGMGLLTARAVVGDAGAAQSTQARGTPSARERTEVDVGAMRAYVADEVAYHQAVIDVVDQSLIPHTQNAELKKTITDMRSALVAHLQHVRQFQSTLR